MNFKIWKKNKEIEYVKADENFDKFIKEIAKEQFLTILTEALSFYQRNDESYVTEKYLASFHKEIVKYFREIQKEIKEQVKYEITNYVNEYLNNIINPEEFIDDVIERINKKQIIK